MRSGGPRAFGLTQISPTRTIRATLKMDDGPGTVSLYRHIIAVLDDGTSLAAIAEDVAYVDLFMHVDGVDGVKKKLR